MSKRVFKEGEMMLGMVMKKSLMQGLKELKQKTHVPLRYLIEKAIENHLKEVANEKEKESSY